ncbi:hypothetical protein KZZ52_19790 [Dactylosporangium sp. AC04546]|uniref:hypothetical protein n=1 Tax=Dactylosporangium sp. AC04546 TaxID=2862460 RepID=UPI001EDCBB08|nr:hypothetical protein [Dactylosporangium sp. AC04546]WVK87540.1 hypothetical protein KZZ52_19790 [Dactylosporangium sp. AC04546]
MRLRMIITAGVTGAAGTALALAAALPAWAAPTPADTEDPAYRAGYLLGRVLLAVGCLVALVLLVATVVILLVRRQRRQAQQYAQPGYPPQPPHPPYR